MSSSLARVVETRASSMCVRKDSTWRSRIRGMQDTGVGILVPIDGFINRRDESREGTSSGHSSSSSSSSIHRITHSTRTGGINADDQHDQHDHQHHRH